jgi:hypothetical protein
MKNFEFHVEVVLDEGKIRYELTIHRDGELDQGPRLLNDVQEVLSWIDHQLEMATEDLTNAHR